MNFFLKIGAVLTVILCLIILVNWFFVLEELTKTSFYTSEMVIRTFWLEITYSLGQIVFVILSWKLIDLSVWNSPNLVDTVEKRASKSFFGYLIFAAVIAVTSLYVALPKFLMIYERYVVFLTSLHRDYNHVSIDRRLSMFYSISLCLILILAIIYNVALFFKILKLRRA